MKYFRLIIANVWRKKTRFFLTIGSFAVAMFLFGLLIAIYNGFYQGIEAAGADRLFVRNKISLITFIPYSYKAKIKAMEGVENVVPFIWFGGYYQDKKNFFAQMAIEPDDYRTVYPEFKVSDEAWEKFSKDRQGCIVGREKAADFGWKVGDRIPLQSTIFQGTWEFNVCGIYEGTREQDDETQMWFQYKYLEENVPFVKGQVGWYIAQLSNPEDADAVIARIDKFFENSPVETKSEPEKMFMIGFAKQMGNIKLILLAVGGVVIFTLLLVTGSTMAMSVRERTSELAVLKTLGFADSLVLVMILAESILYALIGGMLGLSLVKFYTLRGDPTNGMLPSFYLSSLNIVAGLLLTIVTGILSGFIPAINAMRLQIVNALRRI